MPTNPIRVVLVDDHQIMLEAMQALLAVSPELQVVGTATTANAGAQLVAELRPDVAVFDVDFPGVDSFDVVPRVRQQTPSTKILFLTAHLSDVFLNQALRLEASGYILKDEPVARVTDAIIRVHAGNFAFSAKVQERLVFNEKRQTYSLQIENRLCGLTIQQLAILRHIARGESLAQMALALNRSKKSIDCHRYRIMHKLNIHDRVELTLYAIREGLTIV